MLGTKEDSLEIKGILLLRVDTVDHLKVENDDANWYRLKMIGGQGMELTEENKKIVKGFWTAKTKLEGNPNQDTYIDFVGIKGGRFPVNKRK